MTLSMPGDLDEYCRLGDFDVFGCFPVLIAGCKWNKEGRNVHGVTLSLLGYRIFQSCEPFPIECTFTQTVM